MFCLLSNRYGGGDQATTLAATTFQTLKLSLFHRNWQQRYQTKYRQNHHFTQKSYSVEKKLAPQLSPFNKLLLFDK
jgi:hypothetical protein